jgi:flagellar assembly protein FliH
MSDATVIKDEGASYERLDFPSFNHADIAKAGQPATLTRFKKNKTDVVLPTAAELEEIQRQAHEEGYQAGYAEGSQRMATLMDALEQALQQADQNIAQDLLNLSLEVARQMVQQTLKANPEILLNTIREAISSLPHLNQGAHLVLHPDDATMLRASMGEQLSHTGWKIFEDTGIERGGARIETAHSQIDATVGNRWQRIVASIGQDSSWIQE